MGKNFRDQLTINHNALDVEWLSQPKLFMEVSEEAADARAELDRSKLRLEVREAELDKEVRTRPDHFGLDKVTESAVKSAITTHKDYIHLREEFIEQKHEVDVLSAAVAAMEQRKAALERLVILHGQQYFAGPKQPRDLDAEWIREAEKKTARARVTKKRPVEEEA